METESPAFIPTTFNPVSTSYISTQSPPPITARLYPRQPQISHQQRQKPLPPTPATDQPQPQPLSPPKVHHRTQASIDSLYDLLADLDENQLSYLVQELNHTTSSNLAVADAISAFEAAGPVPSPSAAPAGTMQQPSIHRTMSKSQKIRLSLHTMFRAPSLRQTRPKTETQVIEDTDMSTPPTSRRKSPAYKRISRPVFNLPPGITVTDLLTLLEAEFRDHSSASSALSPSTSSSQLPLSPSSASSSFSSASPSSPMTPQPSLNTRAIRRYPSTLDMTLEAERSAGGFEGIGLGMLEPRPTTPACGTPISARGSPITPSWERRRTPPPVVLDGIFEVLENK